MLSRLDASVEMRSKKILGKHFLSQGGELLFGGGVFGKQGNGAFFFYLAEQGSGALFKSENFCVKDRSLGQEDIHVLKADLQDDMEQGTPDSCLCKLLCLKQGQNFPPGLSHALKAEVANSPIQVWRDVKILGKVFQREQSLIQIPAQILWKHAVKKTLIPDIQAGIRDIGKQCTRHKSRPCLSDFSSHGGGGAEGAG